LLNFNIILFTEFHLTKSNMKNILTCLGLFMITTLLSAQTPATISYQAVIRNNSNQLVINQGIGIRISILQGSATGTQVYREIYNPNPQTNANGLMSIEVGSGIALTGTFSSINWKNGPYFIQTEIDPTGGTTYTITGTTQILAVPYALYAASANETDPLFTSWGKNYNDLVNLPDLSGFATQSALSSGLNGKVDKETGKGLSSNDFTNEEKTKLAGIEAQAQKNVQPDWSATDGDALILNKPDLSIYATRDMKDQNITNLAQPENAQDAATKAYVDAHQDARWTGEPITTASISRRGKVGIGIATPTALLHTEGTGTGEGNVLFEGEIKIFTPAGDPPASGGGTRMMWYPDRAAFRVGSLEGRNWDKDSIGHASIAMGYNTKAKGETSFAMGFNSAASGSYSFAMGYSSTALDNSSIAMGYSTTASGWNSIAMGRYAKAVGSNAFAIHLSPFSSNTFEVGTSTFRITGAYYIGGNVAWSNFSDRRLKKNIVTLGHENNLSKILQLNGIRYRWIEHDQLLNLGFIAQDVLNIVPESVRYDELNDLYSMEYTALIPVLVEGIKEQQAFIEQLQQENAHLRASITELEKLKDEVEKIKEMLLIKE
jgi:hypothetical protein